MITSESVTTVRHQTQRIEELLRDMTLEEKISLLAGSTMWTTPPIERLGIPALKVSDGPNGVRGSGSFAGGSVTSACFPVGIALAATWNPDLVEQIGRALGVETKMKGAQMLLAPTVNIHRSPLNGRNFECYSEDPYLSARMAVAYITGLQNEKVGATVKHYVCNDSEFERNTISSEVDERTLREIYLPPFQAAVQEARSWGVMAGYNKVNGVYDSENRTILVDILKEEWGFDGIVMSDWFGTKSTVDAANNGLDLEMPGPPKWRGERLLHAVQAGEVSTDTIDEHVRRMLGIFARAGLLDDREERPEGGEDLPEHRAIIRAAGSEGTVLLKNESNVLPLDLEKLSSIAVIGPNAKTAAIMGGGSAQVSAHYAVTPYAGIGARVGDRVEIGYEIGCTNHRLLPRLDSSLLKPARGEAEHGFSIDYFDNLELSGDPVHQDVTGSSEQAWFGQIAPGVDPKGFSARLTAAFTPQETGAQIFGLSSAGLSRFFVDGREIIDNWTHQTRGGTYFGTGSVEASARVEMRSGETYQLCVEYSNQGASLLSAVRLGYLPPVADDSIAAATALAARSDVALLFVGLNGDWESEGFDRPDMELAGRQAELIEQVASVNPRTVVVLQTGSPISMPWLDRVAGVIQAWYPGQECGNAIADVLFGEVNPSGKLPQTFPRRLEDNPAYINYPGENGRVRYGEGIFVGYRYYDKKDVEPLFPFGFGLSYTSFSYGPLRLSSEALSPDDLLTVSVDVTNSGARAGKEIVQLYVHEVEPAVSRPPKELKAFAKVDLQPGETETVTLTLDRTALAYWDDARHAWVARAGEFELLVGSSSQDLRARSTFRLTKTAVFGGPANGRLALGIDSTIKTLLDDDAARAVLERHVPGICSNPHLVMAMGYSLAQIADFEPSTISAETLQAIARDLTALSSSGSTEELKAERVEHVHNSLERESTPIT